MQSRVPLRVGKQREISAASRKSECRAAAAAGVNEEGHDRRGRRRSRLPNWSVNEEDNEDTRATIGGRRGRNGDRGDGTRILDRGCVNIDSSCLELCLLLGNHLGRRS